MRDILTRAKLPTLGSGRKRDGFTHCGRLCMACIQCDRATEHKCLKTGQVWAITAALNCMSMNVIYKIGCRKCRFFVYIGMTERQFCQRLAEHRGNVMRKVTGHPIGKHFCQVGHDVTDMIPLPIEKVVGNRAILRQREKVWIRRYDAISSDGANSRD